MSDYQTDFKILNEVETEEGKKLNVLVAAPNNIIESSGINKKAKFKTKFIDSTSNAISKIFASRSYGFHDENSSIGTGYRGQTTTVTILSEEIYYLAVLFYGFEHIMN